MRNSYRALAIVAVVAPLVATMMQTVIHLVYAMNWYGLGINAGKIYILQTLLPSLLTGSSLMASTIVSTLGVTLAAQSRRWGWLIGFVTLGLIAAFPTSVIFAAVPYSALAASLDNAGVVLYLQFGLQFLPTIAALIFVFTGKRPQPAAVSPAGAFPYAQAPR